MTELTEKKLYKILEEHKHWINEDCKNWEEMRADLSNADLSDSDLRSANLRGTYLLNADLSNADLRGANLRNANLRGTKNVPYFPMVCPEEGRFYRLEKGRSQ